MYAHRLRVLRLLSWDDRQLLALAWALLGLARLTILVTPFSYVRHRLGDHGTPPFDSRSPASTPVDDATRLRARRIGAALTTAARHAPWRSDCYPQALAARSMLARAGIVHSVQFGLRRDETDVLRAHAWVTVGDVVVTGGDVSDYVVVRSFTWSPRSSRVKASR